MSVQSEMITLSPDQWKRALAAYISAQCGKDIAPSQVSCAQHYSKDEHEGPYGHSLPHQVVTTLDGDLLVVVVWPEITTLIYNPDQSNPDSVTR